MSEERFLELLALRNEEPGMVSPGLLQSSARAYIAEAEKCYSDIEVKLASQDTQDVIYYDDGGQWVPGEASADYVLNGRKWGPDSPFTMPPGTPGGTVTYSFMPNGVDLSAEGNSSYGSNVAVTSLPGYQACFLTEIRNAFAAWSAAADIQFVEVSDNGLAFDALGATGDIRIGAHTFDGSSGIIAHAYFPPPNGNTGAGDLHFDRAENWTCNSSGIDIGIVATHELGHSIGLSHENTSTVAVMDPIYNPALTSLQPDDINGAVAIYGVYALVVPTPIAPSGTISTGTPTFKWSVSPGAISYKLAVYSDSAVAYVIQQIVPSSACGASECSLASPVNLSSGNYRFKVLASGSSGSTAYSNWLYFNVSGVVLPPPSAPPILIAPNTTVDTHRPTFQWNAVTDATFYRLAIYSYDTKVYVVVENVYPSCAAGVCSYTPYTWDLVNGSYGYKMRSRNSSGYTDYSAMMKFSVSSNLPVAPTLLAPSGTVGANPPPFQWNAVAGATSYQLLVYSIASGSYVVDTEVYPTACSGSVCTYTPASALASGGYKFKMMTTNVYGNSGYSGFMSFTVP